MKPVPVRGVAFSGITFAYAGWLFPSGPEAYVDMQSGFRTLPSSTGNDDTWVPVPGNIQMHTVADVTVSNCTFTHLGAVALEIDNGSQNVAVVNNTFTDVSCGGLYFGQVNDANVSVALENRDFLVAENLFAGVPAELHDCAALLGGFLTNATISHNTILNATNTGISLGWGWSRDEAIAGANVIDGNYLLGGNSLLVDGGSIYVLGPQQGSVMSNNFINTQLNLYGVRVRSRDAVRCNRCAM